MITVPNRIETRTEPATLSDDLRGLISVYARRWRLILTTIVFFLVLGVGYIWLATPQYMSSVDIFIDPRERNLLNLGVAPSGLGSSSQGADTALVESQISILESRWVLDRLIRQENLETNAEFGAATSEGLSALLRSWAKTIVYGPNVQSYDSMSPFDRALLKLDKSLKVKRVGQTYVINVAMTTRSPDLSSRLANALAQIYLDEGQNAGDTSAVESARSLEARFAELKQASDESQRQVEAYRNAQGLISSQGVLFDERKLADLSTQVMTATIATKAAKSALDEITRSAQSAGNFVLSTDVGGQLRLQLDRAISDEQALIRTYGERHPRLADARERRQSVEAAFAAEIGRARARAQSDFEKASDTEKSLKALLAEAESRVNTTNSASVKLRQLEEIAERDRTLYETFATRAQKARAQVSLPTTTARIISQAEPASRPSEPRVPIVLGVALFLGVLAGFGLAWLLHLFTPPVRSSSIGLVPKSQENYANAAE